MIAFAMRPLLVPLCAVVLLGLPDATQGKPAIPDWLYSAPVPSLCEHPAGNLVGGFLPGVPENHGGVALRSLDSGGMVAQGTLEKGRRVVAAAMRCNRGGVGWPDKIVVYDHRAEIVDTIDLFALTRGGRESVRRIWIERRTLFIDIVNITRSGDPLCCGSVSARAQLRLRPQHDLVARRVSTYRERTTARRFVRAVNRGKRRAARRFATADAVSQVWRTRRFLTRLSLRNCYGRIDSIWSRVFGSHPNAGRMCMVVAKLKSSDDVYSLGLLMERRGWKGWRVASTVNVGH